MPDGEVVALGSRGVVGSGATHRMVCRVWPLLESGGVWAGWLFRFLMMLLSL